MTDDNTTGRCPLCFKAKSLQPIPIRGTSVQVCRGCYFEIDRVLGFLAFNGVGAGPIVDGGLLGGRQSRGDSGEPDKTDRDNGGDSAVHGRPATRNETEVEAQSAMSGPEMTEKGPSDQEGSPSKAKRKR